MRKQFVYAMILFVASIIFLGCDDNSTDPDDNNTNNESIVGFWQRSLVVIETYEILIEYKEDGTYEARVTGDNYDETVIGNYQFEDNELSLFDDVCGMEVEGRYNVTLTSDMMEVEVISDPCARADNMDGTWAKVVP